MKAIRMKANERQHDVKLILLFLLLLRILTVIKLGGVYFMGEGLFLHYMIKIQQCQHKK